MQTIATRSENNVRTVFDECRIRLSKYVREHMIAVSNVKDSLQGREIF